MSAARQPKKILVIADKNWEADPLVAVLTNPKLRPKSALDIWAPGRAGLFTTPASAPRPQGGPTRRIGIDLSTAGGKIEASVEVYCVEDWMGPRRGTKAKIKHALPGILKAAGAKPDFVVAFGTASFPDTTSYNGCVVAGTNAYLFNPYRHPPTGVAHDTSHDWDSRAKVGHLLTSAAGAKFLGALKTDTTVLQFVSLLMSPVPCNPAEPAVIAAANYIALGDINITNYDDFAWADAAAFEQCRKDNPSHPVGSVETTHGLIRLMTDAPFLFLSGITNRLGYFDQEQATNSISQNNIAAHNAGLVLAWLLPQIETFLTAGEHHETQGAGQPGPTAVNH